MANEKLGVDIEHLAKTIAEDINKFGDVGEPKDLRSIDFAAFSPAATLEIMKSAFAGVRAKAEESMSRSETASGNISDSIKRSAEARRVELLAGLDDLNKTEIKDVAESKTILDRISTRAVLINRRLDELKIGATTKAINFRIPGITGGVVRKP